MKRTLLAGLIGVAGIAGAAAQSLKTVQPIAISEAKDHPGCYIYVKPDGSRLMFQAKPVAARGNCPADFQRGNVVRFGAETYRLRIPAKNADCIITPQGVGRCQPGVIDNRPHASPPATQPQQSPPATEPVPRNEPPAPNELVPPTAPLPNAGRTL